MKRLIVLLLCLLFCLPLTAMAEDWEDDWEDEDAWDLEEWLDEAPGFDSPSNATWKTIGAKKAAKLAVYSAPFDDAWRGANGKASVATGTGFRLLGAAQDGQWLMIEYGVDKKARRVGWIRTPDGTDADDLFEYVWYCRRLPCKVTESVSFTDDPRGTQRQVRKLAAGEEVIAMLSLENKGTLWAYVETTVDGKPAWGFVPLDALEAVPLSRLEGNRIVITEGVTCIGETGEWSWDPDTEESTYTSELINPGDVWSPGIFLWDDYNLPFVDEIVLPSTLRTIGGEAIVGGQIGTLRLPGSLTGVGRYVAYGAYIDRIVMAADYTGDVIVGEYTVINAYEVEPGNPRYSSVDGVLFSADRKTLVRYPNGKTESHYNVPAGTEVIGAFAFTDDGEGLPLTSISLPIGLKEIETCAFSGCTRLLSLTVPLTVTKLDATAFDTCVSLERLSLPPGLKAEFNSDWAEQADFTYFNGDNGSTAANKSKAKTGNEYDEYDDWDSHSVAVRLAASDGENPVPCYKTAEDTVPFTTLSTGHYGSFSETQNGRAHVYVFEDDFSDCWVELSMLQPSVSNAFFAIIDAVPNETGLTADVWEGHDPQEATFYYMSDIQDNDVMFYFPDGESIDVPVNLTIPYRKDDGAGRRMGVLYVDSDEENWDYYVTQPIRILDAPDGGYAGVAFKGDQALILEERDGWFHVKTLRAEGWVTAEQVVEVLVKGRE